MNPITSFPRALRSIAVGICLLAVSAGAADDPPELTKLRDSFNKRVRSMLEPLVLKYKVELEKIEKKLAAEGKLDAALRVREAGQVDLLAPFEEGAKSPVAEVGRQKSKVTKALENSVWTMHDGGALLKSKPLYMLLQPGGVAMLWGGKPGTWKVTGSREVELISASWGNKPIKMKLSDDLTSYTGEFSGDNTARAGDLISVGAK